MQFIVHNCLRQGQPMPERSGLPINQRPNPSIERTASGLRPTAAAHVKRYRAQIHIINAVSFLVSRAPRREVGEFSSVYLIEQNPLRKGNRTGGAFVQRKEARVGGAPQRTAESGSAGGSTEALAQHKLPRTRVKVHALCASAATKGWRRVAWSNTMLAPDVQRPLRKA